jgi:hypothetical protein
MVSILLGLVALSCHDEGHLVDSAAAWQFTGGIIFELNAGSRASGICAIDPNEAIGKTHPLVPGAAEPRVSPDGKKLAYAGPTDHRLLILDLPSGQRELTHRIPVV